MLEEMLQPVWEPARTEVLEVTLLQVLVATQVAMHQEALVLA